MIAQQLAGKAIRDAYFLSVFDAEVLPKVMTVASVLSVVSVFAVTRLYRSFAPARLVPLFFAISGGLFVLEWALSARSPRLSAALMYLHTTGFGAVAISGFWGVVSERFDPYTAKRVITRVAGGATLGGVVGGVAAWQGAQLISIPAMLIALAAVNGFCAVTLLSIGSGSESTAREEERNAPPWEVFEETPYLVHLALLVGVLALGTAGIDYVFKATAAATAKDKTALVSFFSLFYLAVGVLTFVLQSLVGNRIVRQAGLKTAVSSLPGAMVILGGIGLLYPTAAILAFLRGGAAVAESSLYRSGYELLYSPLSPLQKRSAKTLIDVGADKIGAALGGAVAVFLVGLIPEVATTVLLIVGVGCAMIGLWLTQRLATGYVGALEDSLASGRDTEDLSVEAHAPAASLRAAARLPETSVSVLDPVVVRARPTATVQPAEPDWPAKDPTGDLRALSALLRRDPQGIEWALARGNPVPALWVPAMVLLLDEPPVADRVMTRLTQVAPAHVGMLSDMLLSRRAPLEVRRRITHVLGQVVTARSAQGLVMALGAEPFEVRYRAAVALSAVIRRNPAVNVDRNAVFGACSAEIERAHNNFFGSGTRTGGELSAAGTEAGRGVAFCIRLLSVVLPHEPLFNALDALGEEDAGRRGTGLEYLENVLPARLQARLLPFFSNRAIAQYARREDELILSEIAEDDVDISEAVERLLNTARERTGGRHATSTL